MIKAGLDESIKGKLNKKVKPQAKNYYQRWKKLGFNSKWGRVKEKNRKVPHKYRGRIRIPKKLYSSVLIQGAAV